MYRADLSRRLGPAFDAAAMDAPATGMMDQFYTSHHAGGVIYLCIRDNNNPWYGYAIRRLDKELT